MKKKRKFDAEFLLATPMILWTLIFVGCTIVFIVVLSFLTRNPDGDGVIFRFSLESYQKLLRPTYIRVFLRTLKLGFETTLLCALIGYPFGYFMAKTKGRLRSFLLLMIIVPFWTNALVRIYGWRTLMTGDDPINAFLVAIGILKEPISMLNTHGAVLLGMVYGLLPFMILPVYTGAEKLDPNLSAAGRDLGANPFRVFLTVELPLTLPGLLSGCVLVFVPSLALFFISDLLGGVNDILIGNLVRDQLLESHDWPFAAALSVVLLALTAIVMLIYRKITGKRSGMELF